MNPFKKFIKKPGRHRIHQADSRERAAEDRAARGEAELRATEAAVYRSADLARREIRGFGSSDPARTEWIPPKPGGGGRGI